MMHAPLSAVAQEWLRTKEALLAAHPELADDLALFADTLDGEAAALDVIAGLVRQAREDEAFVAANKALAADYADRASNLTERASRRKAAALALMDAIGEKTVRRPEFTITRVESRPSLILTDEEAIPEPFFRYTRSVNKLDVKAALERGETVPGAVLSNGAPHITVRMK